MPTGNMCAKCGAPLDAAARHGICPKCLFQQLAEGPGDPDPQIDSQDTAPTADLPGLPEYPQAPSNAGRRFGDYELLEELGRGGMGLVYKARQLSMGRHVALKLLAFGPLAGPEVVKRFRMEATSAGALQHPNIVAIHEVGIHQDQHYLVMDYVPGPNLAALAANQPWPAQKGASLVKMLSEAIHYAHQHGILHRDLKPSNILIDANGQPKITDFGLAKRLVGTDSTPSPTASDLSRDAVESVLTESLTLTGQVLGSPNYMPPEQAGAKRGSVRAWSDVYSLGAILYHLLTGRPPFAGETITATLHQVLETEAASPRLLNPRVPVDLETICLKCLEKEPERRYATARELAEELGRFLNSEPILARPINRLQRLWRWCRRKPVVASLTSATLLLLLTVAIGSPIAVYRIDRERKQVEQQSQRTEQQRQRAVKSEAEMRAQLYAANLNLAQQAWEQNSITRFKQLLEDTKDYRDRGFEWFYWQKQLKQERWTFHVPGTTDANPRIPLVAFSPNGQSVLGWGGNNLIRVWDLTTGRETLALKGSRPAFSPDGRQLLFGQGSDVVIWDLELGQEISRWPGHGGPIFGALFSPDGRAIAAWTDDDTIRTWDARNGAERVTLECKTDLTRLERNTSLKTGSIQTLAYSPDGRELLAAGFDGFLPIWDSSTGEELRVLDGSGGAFRSAVFSPDGRFILAAGNDSSTARVWERSTGKEHRVLRGHNDVVESAAFSPDGTQILTASWDQTARLWDFRTGREVRVFKGHEHWLQSAAFSRQGDLVATGDRNGEVKVWSLRRSGESLLLSGHNRAVLSASFSPDGKRLVTASWDRSVKIWDVDQRKDMLTFTRHQDLVQRAEFSPDGQKVLSASRDGRALLWRSDTGEILHEFKSEEMANDSGAIAFSRDGTRLAVASHAAPSFVRVWNASDGTLIATTPATSASCSLTFSPDGRYIATANWDWVARLWDTATGEPLRMFNGHSNWVRSVDFSSDGQRLLTASEDRTIRIWDVATGKELASLSGHKDHVLSAQFSPSGNRILSASRDGTAILWDAIHRRPLLTLKGHSGHVHSAVFSPDGHRIATTSGDGTVSLWDAGDGETARR